MVSSFLKIRANKFYEKKISSLLKGFIKKHESPTNGGIPTWNGWALAESLRRYADLSLAALVE